MAAISFNTLFLAPPTATSPDNRFPPVTTNRSLTRVSVNSGMGQCQFPTASSARYGLTMAVHLTRIYTRTGDDGTTGLSDFSRVSKNDARLAAYADCDETNAAIGVAVALGNPGEQILNVLRQIQNDLFDAGADLSTPVVENPEHPPLRITQSYIDRLESWCDEFNEPLPALNSFVLPGGTPLSALLHVARTVARRAERSAWQAVEAHPDSRSACCRPSTSTGCPTCCSSCRGWPTPTATCCGNRADERLREDRRPVPQRIRTSGAARAATAATPARTEMRSAHRDPAPLRSPAGVPDWCRAVRERRSRRS